MTAKKIMVETSVYTTFIVPLDELLAAYIPEEERSETTHSWWVSSGTNEGNVEFVRMERVAIAHDDQGRERLEKREEKQRDES